MTITGLCIFGVVCFIVGWIRGAIANHNHVSKNKRTWNAATIEEIDKAIDEVAFDQECSDRSIVVICDGLEYLKEEIKNNGKL